MSSENSDSRFLTPDSRSKATWWLLPLLILIVSALTAAGLLAFEPSPARSSAGCSGALSTDFSCHQQRYKDLVLESGVEAAFAELKSEHKKSDFVRSACHQLTHAIGRAAAERHGGVSGAYTRGEHFCGTGYYHGVMETVTAGMGAGAIPAEADALCAGPREDQERSANHSGCAHGLGHGFMGVLDNELFESLKACDALTDAWEREHCYNGVFMENLPDSDNRSHPSKYLKEDEPLYPCTDVEARYKDQCYRMQISHALRTQGNDFAKTFDLCASIEGDPRTTCYRGLGGEAFYQGSVRNVTDPGAAGYADMLCALGEDYEARSNCVEGAVRNFIYSNLYDARSDTRIEAYCWSFATDLRPACLKAAEDYYRDFGLD